MFGRWPCCCDPHHKFVNICRIDPATGEVLYKKHVSTIWGSPLNAYGTSTPLDPDDLVFLCSRLCGTRWIVVGTHPTTGTFVTYVRDTTTGNLIFYGDTGVTAPVTSWVGSRRSVGSEIVIATWAVETFELPDTTEVQACRYYMIRVDGSGGVTVNSYMPPAITPTDGTHPQSYLWSNTPGAGAVSNSLSYTGGHPVPLSRIALDAEGNFYFSFKYRPIPAPFPPTTYANDVGIFMIDKNASPQVAQHDLYNALAAFYPFTDSAQILFGDDSSGDTLFGTIDSGGVTIEYTHVFGSGAITFIWPWGTLTPDGAHCIALSAATLTRFAVDEFGDLGEQYVYHFEQNSNTGGTVVGTDFDADFYPMSDNAGIGSLRFWSLTVLNGTDWQVEVTYPESGPDGFDQHEFIVQDGFTAPSLSVMADCRAAGANQAVVEAGLSSDVRTSPHTGQSQSPSLSCLEFNTSTQQVGVVWSVYETPRYRGLDSAGGLFCFDDEAGIPYEDLEPVS